MEYALKINIIEPFAKVILQVVKKSRFFNYSPLSLCPFPPRGAKDVVVPHLFPAPSGGRMSEGQKGGFIHCVRLLQKPPLRKNIHNFRIQESEIRVPFPRTQMYPGIHG
jgi:hypothetical protein